MENTTLDQQIKELQQILRDSENIVFFGGAGVSTESNIPDFRSEQGLYNARSKYGFDPETMLSHSFFEDYPDKFYDYYLHELIYPEARPNGAHLALAQLEAMGKLKAVVTQNIDGLHQQAGSAQVLELHGSVLRNYCVNCGARYDVDFMLTHQGGVPHCLDCGSIVRPDVVLYEEPLNDRIMEKAVDAISQADTVIVGGTSLVVYPAAGLLRYAHCRKLVLINKSATALDKKADLVIRDSIGKVLQQAVAGI